MASLFLGFGSANAKIIYVNGSSETAGNGTSWAKPFIYLRDALENSLPGDQVYVAKGIYYPDDGLTGFFGDRELAFEVNGLKIYGGFEGNESSLSQRDPVANPTILSGEIWPVTPETKGYERYWSLHVVVLKSNSTFDGLTIEKGRANGDASPYNQGGGVLIPAGSKLTLNNSIIRENLAGESGGGISGDVQATNSVFSNNVVNNEHLLVKDKPIHLWLHSPACNGGAISGNVTAENCQFIENQVTTHSLDIGVTTSAIGGAISGTTITLKNCEFDANSATSTSDFVHDLPAKPSGSDASSRGGAVSGDLTATKCTFTNNLASATSFATDGDKTTYLANPSCYGGATAGPIKAVNCSFDKNETNSQALTGDVAKVVSYGGAVYAEGQSQMANCTFTSNNSKGVLDASIVSPDNFPSRFGGGVYAVTTTFPMTNCTFLDNGTNGNASALCCNGSVNILSNIFWYTVDTQGTLRLKNPIHVTGKSRISNRLYPTPSTETLNVLKGGIVNVTKDVGADIDFGEPTSRTLIEADPMFIDAADPIGPDGIWRTADDGVRIDAGSSAAGKGVALFLPKDTADLDEDGNTAENIPIDAAGFVRVQNGSLDLGAYEKGDLVFAPDIRVDEPIGTALDDGGTAIDFSTTQGIARTFVIRNDGLADLKNLVVTGDGVDISSFKFTQPGSKLLTSGASTSFTVTFLPLFSGIRHAAIHIASNDPDEGSFDIALLGNALLPDIGVEYPAGTGLVDDVSTIDFGDLGSNLSATKTFTVINSGVGNLSIQNIVASGPNAANFMVSAPVKTLLTPNGTTTFNVTFIPGGTGNRAASILVQSSDPDGESSFLINVTGNGFGLPEISVNQPFSKELVDGATNNFGSVKVSSLYSKTFVIKNVGSAVLKNIAVSLSGSSTFTATKLSVNKLNPGGQANVTVTFKPTSAGGKTAVLTFASSDADESLINVTLTGKGVSKSTSSAFAFSATSAGFSGSPALDHPIGAVSVSKAADGSKHLVLTIEKTAGWELSKHTVEVSPNLVNWFSGANHTTTLLDSPTVLKVRDNTPLTGEGKRFIRLK